MTTGHRQLKRWHLIFYLRVFDNNTGELLGHLADLTTEGVMLVSDQDIPVGKDYVLKMEYPERDNRKQGSIILNAHSLWSNPDINSQFYDNGFKLIDPSAESVTILRELIDELAF